VAILSMAGLILLPATPPGDQSGASQGFGLSFATPTPPLSAAIPREFVPPVGPTATARVDSTAPPAGDNSTPVPPPVINWTQEEKYALSWLCWYEIRGFGSKKIDACLSVISTVRARYAYPNSGFGTHDVLSTLRAPGQFTGVNFDTTKPAPDPDLLSAVEQYAAGARGSCNGYLYYDSLPGGPATCVISGNGQYEEFHNASR
jgi:hypothetical protein